MSKNVSYIIELLDKTKSAFASVKSGFSKVNESAKKTQTTINLLPNSIGGLEKRLESLKHKQKQAFTVEGIKHYQKEINATEKQLSKLNSFKGPGGIKGFANKLAGQSPMMGNVMSSLTSPAGMIVAGGAVVYKGFEKMVGGAMLFDEGMAKVNGTLQLTPDKLKGVSADVLKFAKNSTTAIADVPDAFYKIVSATGGDLPQSMSILKTSLKGAEAGFTDINGVADATVNIMNAVGKANTNANEVTDVLFATLNKGKAEFSDVANYLPKLIPISNNLGTSFKETAGSFAFLTANGLKAEASTTALQNVMKAFGTDKIRNNFKKIGIDIFDSNGKMRSMAAISGDLGRSLDGLTDQERMQKLESLGLDQEAALGMSIMASKADELGKTIDYVTQSGGELQRTLDSSSTPMNTLKKLGNQFTGLMIELGNKVLPAINTALEKALGWITGITEGISSAYEKSELFRDVVDALSWSFSQLWEGATLYFSSVGDAFDNANKQMEAYGTSWSDLGDRLDKAYTWHKKQIKGFVSGAVAVLKLLKAAWDALWSGDTKALKNLSFKKIQEAFNSGYSEELTKTKNAQKTTIDIVKPPPIVKAGEKTTPIKPFIPGKSDNKGMEGVSGGLSSVSGGGREQKIITINLSKLVENVTVNSQNLTEGVNEIQSKVEEAFLRILNSANSVQYG